MPEFDKVEDTTFVPMLGRIYASHNFPNILKDDKALSIEGMLPKDIKGKDTQTQYTYMASAVRSVNMDRYIKDFMNRHDNGVIVQLGAGLETTFYRNDDGKTMWYEIDLPAVIEYRKELLGENERERYISADAFGEEWIKEVRANHEDAPILVTASGLFYYFERDKVVGLLKALKSYGDIEVVFDTVNKSGMKRMSKYMKQVGHSDASMYFYVDKASDFSSEIGATSYKEEPYYAHIDKKGLAFGTKMTMKLSDLFKMVKMEYFKFN